MGHDLGHTPFGHAGESALSHAQGHSFRHNEQSLRIVEVLLKDGQGLNLTYPVREGIYLHSKGRKSVAATAWGTASTFEGQIIKVADAVAYINHDIDDAVRAGIIRDADLPRDLIAELGETHALRINAMVCDMIDFNWWLTGEGTPPAEQVLTMSPRMLELTNGLREFLYEQRLPDLGGERGRQQSAQND